MGNTQHTNCPKRSKIQTTTNNLPLKPIMTEEEFFKTWNTWKCDFLLYKKTHVRIHDDKNRWGNMLLNLMGPVGQNIHNKFIFTSAYDNDNVDVLLQKFDQYFVFGRKRKLHQENSLSYVKELQSLIPEGSMKNREEMIRTKILLEIDKIQFESTAKKLIRTFTYSQTFYNLTLNEIAFIWDLYSNGDSANSCKRCGNNHISNKCPALGKQCLKCKDLNHFSQRCPKNYIIECNYCGGSHIRKNCAAFNEVCTICGRQNHFSWKCSSIFVSNCKFCNMSHAASRLLCPARNTICNICGQRGHFPVKCGNRSYTSK